LLSKEYPSIEIVCFLFYAIHFNSVVILKVYPPWRWYEKQDGIRSLQKKDKDPAPEFYNIVFERPKVCCEYTFFMLRLTYRYMHLMLDFWFKKIPVHPWSDAQTVMQGDSLGYDVLVVDAMHKANFASRLCHSCRPNCEAK
jgi:hypothetical protein